MEAGDHAGFARQLSRVSGAARYADPDELTTAIQYLAPVLGRAGGLFAKTALLAGAFVEWGGSPLPLRHVLPRRTVAAMESCALFPEVWPLASAGLPLPDRADLAAMPGVTGALVRLARRRGLAEASAVQIATSWFDVDDWLQSLITAMALREFRAVMADRDQVRDGAAALADELLAAHWVHGLSVVLDDEPLVALDYASRRGFHLTMSGIGDNFQLHTLLADRLTSGTPPALPGLEPPRRSWVAAATDGARRLRAADPILRRFRLFDGHGAYVFPEGRPADIQPLDGTRVVILHPPLGRFAWSAGRAYRHMTPTLTLDRILAPAEAARWLARVSPAQQTDLMAVHRAAGSTAR